MGDDTQVECWSRAKRSLLTAATSLASARSEEDCQSIGLLCRETLISLAQAVTPKKLITTDGIDASPSDATRRLDTFITDTARGSSREEERTFARSCVTLASKLVHQRTAGTREAALCLCATEAMLRVVGLIAGFESAGPRIQVVFEGTEKERLIQVTPSFSEDLPSFRYRRRVEGLLERRRKGGHEPLESMLESLRTMPSILGGKRLESFTTEELETRLAAFDIAEWKERDDYERFEKKGVRLNLSLYNPGQHYLEDALVFLTIPKVPGLGVATRVPPEPSTDYSSRLLSTFHVDRYYPDVAEEDDRWVVSSQVGDLRHKVRTAAFREPLRISVTEQAAGESFPLTCVIHGRQLPDPIQADLVLEVLRITRE